MIRGSPSARSEVDLPKLVRGVGLSTRASAVGTKIRLPELTGVAVGVAVAVIVGEGVGVEVGVLVGGVVAVAVGVGVKVAVGALVGVGVAVAEGVGVLVGVGVQVAVGEGVTVAVPEPYSTTSWGELAPDSREASPMAEEEVVTRARLSVPLPETREVTSTDVQALAAKPGVEPTTVEEMAGALL